jgi:hypothetical protein
VRVRVETPRGVLVDIGGPYVLAPVRGAIRGTGGRVIGHFLLAPQDDMGYMLLAHAFAGARDARRGYAGDGDTLTGTVVYGGVTYRAFSFLARVPGGGVVDLVVVW